jgi:putative redox protein
MATMSVSYEGGDRFTASVRGHQIPVDQPESDGGADAAPTPVELLVASLATCVGHYARRYLARHDLPTEGLAVDAEWEIVRNPARLGPVTVRLTVPEGVPDERRGPLLAMASHCTVHNTLEQAPEVSITLV